MKTIIKLTLLLALLMPATAVASPITLQQAQQNVVSFLENKGKSISFSSLRQAQLRSTSTATESYYVFNIGSNEGYVIAAGDDCAPAILGYADAGYIDMDSMPVNLKSWLEEYAHQIQFMKENGFASSKAPKLTSGYAVISPLMTTTWGQDDPYNQNCPDFFSYGKCVTGCVATAMAQVMYYHRANSVTQTTARIPAYTCRHRWISGSDTLQISVDAIPAGSPIDWSNMLDSYSGSATSAQKDAVANLMKYCGAAVQMDYADGWNGGSGAYSSDVPSALKSYFNYSDQTTLKYRSDYSSDAAWESLVYNELSSSRPVYYSGRNSSGGHAFVCDGYDGSGYYHINWGWTSTSDGYFLLTALNPDAQGTGGTSSGYNNNQAVVINASPKSSSPSNPVLATSISLNKTSAELNTGETTQLTATVLPSNATNKNVTWNTSNSSVATVSSSGLVTAKAAGNTTITARTTDGSNLSVSCSVTVKQSPVLVTSISLNKTSAEINTGGTLQLTATVLPNNATNKTVTWATSNSSVATVSSNGLVTANAVGNATITAQTTDGSNLSVSCSVTVKQSSVLVTSISLNKTSAELNTGGTLQLTATVLPSNATNKTVTWTTSNSSVATVNSDGLVMAKAVGNATITAKTTDGTNLSATCNITVSNSSIISFADANVKALCVQNWDTNGDGELSTSEAAAVTSLGGVFESKENITSFDELVYFSGLSSIGDRYFYKCSRLTSVTVPNSVTRIGHNAFRHSGLKCVSIPNSVIVIEPGAFANCISIESIIVDNNNPHYDSRSNCNAIIESSTNRLISGCKNTIIPNTVKSIGYLAFIGCSGLSSISIPNSVDTIGIHAFSYCDGLKTIYIPNSVTSIGDRAFAECTGLTSIDIPNSVTEIGDYAFLNCDGLTSITIPNSVTSIGGGAFYSCDGLKDVYSYIEHLSVVTMGNSVFLLYPADYSKRTLHVPSGLVSTYQANTSWYPYFGAIVEMEPFVLATSVQLNQMTAEATVGGTLQLSATVLPSNATNKAVTWTTSNSSVATVDSNGLVTAVAPGTATITATTTDGSNLSASCAVTVTGNLSDYDNYLSMEDVEAFRGDTIVIPVKMTNEASIISFQTDIFLPEGLELMQEDGEYIIDPSERMTRTHSIMSNEVSNGAIRVLCYSSNYKPFTGNSGDDLFYITVKVADDAEGDYTIQLKNTLLTNTDFVDLAAPDVAANVNVKAYLLGDANNSGTVTVGDVVATAQYVLEMNPQPFVFEAADVNMDNNITVADVSRIAWMVLNPAMNAPMRAPAQWNNGDLMGAEGISLMPGETRRVSITLDNEMDYSAFQLDLKLPSGLTASNFQLTGRASGHAFDVNTLQNGDIRALCYSPLLTAISGHEGALLTFDVTATGNVSGDITVDGIELVTTTCQSVKLDAFTIGVNDASAVNEPANGKTIARMDYFNLAGQQIERPESGVTLVVTTYTDGTRSVNKIFR